MVGWVSASVALCLVGKILATVFARSLTNFTCKLFMMRGGTLFILGHGVKGQSQLWHFVYKTLWARYRLQFLRDHFQTSLVSCSGWEYLGHGTKFQGQLWPPARGSHALRCLVFFFMHHYLGWMSGLISFVRAQSFEERKASRNTTHYSEIRTHILEIHSQTPD